MLTLDYAALYLRALEHAAQTLVDALADGIAIDEARRDVEALLGAELDPKTYLDRVFGGTRP